jgi:excisionase family DNA binding protein
LQESIGLTRIERLAGMAAAGFGAPRRRARPGRRKGPQSWAALKFSAGSDEGISATHEPIEANMSLSVSPAPRRSERQLVFTSSQAARYLGVSLATVRRWTDAGHISCYRTPGGQRRFSRAQMDDFISSMQRTGTAEEPRVVEQLSAHAQVA